jgi:hypothetical protein
LDSFILREAGLGRSDPARGDGGAQILDDVVEAESRFGATHDRPSGIRLG